MIDTIYAKGDRDGVTTYYQYEGTPANTVIELLEGLGCADIQLIDEPEFLEGTKKP